MKAISKSNVLIDTKVLTEEEQVLLEEQKVISKPKQKSNKVVLKNKMLNDSVLRNK